MADLFKFLFDDLLVDSSLLGILGGSLLVLFPLDKRDDSPSGSPGTHYVLEGN